MSELNKLKVVDFTAGRLSSDDINTNIPFADNFEKTRTIQQANAVIGAYVNRNYTDMQNKADKDEIPTKVSELENDVGYITDGDIPSKTSDLINDGEDGEHPFITKEVDNLTNYTDTETLYGDISDINTNLQGLNDAIDLQLPNRIGDIVVDSIRSKNMFSLNSRFVSYSDAKYDLLFDGIKVTNTSSSGNNNAVRFIVFDVTKFIGETLTLSAKAVSSASNPGCMYMRLCKSDGTTSDASYPAQLTSSTTNGNIKVSYTIPSGIGDYHYLMIAFYSSRNYIPTVNSYVNYTNIQLEKGSTVTPYRPYQNLDGMETYYTNETVIGTWINGKPLYRKVFDIGSLPNNSTKTVSTGLSNIIPRNLYGYGYNSNTKVMVALNNGSPVGLNLQIQAYYSDGNILIQTGTDRSSYSGYVTLEYTKTTD